MLLFTTELSPTQRKLELSPQKALNPVFDDSLIPLVCILTVKVGLMKKGDIYIRRAYSAFDLISAFGGLAVGIFLILQMGMVVYSRRWFKLALTQSEFRI